jgi:uncharacterized protein YggE
MLTELRQALGAGAEIKTLSYSLAPLYRFAEEGGNPTLAGYAATNVVQVKINDLTQVDKIIDLGVQSGANQIHRLQFTLQDEQAVRTQAIREAVTKARIQAEAIAASLGLRIVRVLFVEEGGPVSLRPLTAEAGAERADTAAMSTPIEPGTIEVRATITLTVEIAP